MDKGTIFINTLCAHPGGERVRDCFFCGTCTAGCPVSLLTASYNPRQMMRRIAARQGAELLASDEIWKCNQCHTCVAHCPQDVRFADIIRALREMAVAEGLRSAKFAERVTALEAQANRQKLEDVQALLDMEAPPDT